MFSENLVLSPENVSPFPFETNRGHCSSIRYMVSAGAGASQDHSTLSDDLPKSNLLPSSFHSWGTFCSKPVYQRVKKIVLETSPDLIKAKLDFIARRERRRTKGRWGGGGLPAPVPADWFLVP